MKKILILLAVIALSITPTARAQDAAVEERLNKLAGQLEDMQTARVKLEKQIGELTREVFSLREEMSKPAGNFASQEELKKLAEKLQEVDQKRVADNEKILTTLEKLGKGGGTKPSRPPSHRPPESPVGSGSPEKGYEYVIQSGDTVSTIALAYREKGVKITSDQILKANPGLKPNSLRVGQKIFIPAPAP